ncbi:MAG: EscU/YscU/HrcU family type III secretion system export apparatus switch protein, partial [Deltaproteobacteria bacterium]|nr:EscU/YscU/HrcU family type III secretion system export apparatus switch protein [Deltaproteobacteria bacterium]
MPWQEDRDQRTESATPRRRQEAREKGQVAKSTEVGSTVILISGLVVFYFFGWGMIQSIKDIMAESISRSGSTILTQETIGAIFKNTIMDMSYVLFPITIFPIIGIMANVMQVGLLFTLEPLTPNFSKINPLEGIKRIVSERALAELIKGIFKLIVIGYMSYIVIKGEMVRFAPLVDMSMTGIIFYLGSISFKIFIATLWVLIIIAILDYAFNKWEMEKGLRMTKQEVKEEVKETEGQPLIKSRIRSM